MRRDQWGGIAHLCSVVLDLQLDVLDLCERPQLGEAERLVALREADDKVHHGGGGVGRGHHFCLMSCPGASPGGLGNGCLASAEFSARKLWLSLRG